MLGIRTNIPFLLAILQHPRFVAGDIDTGFLDAEGAGLRAADDRDVPEAAVAAVGISQRRPTAALHAPTVRASRGGLVIASTRSSTPDARSGHPDDTVDHRPAVTASIASPTATRQWTVAVAGPPDNRWVCVDGQVAAAGVAPASAAGSRGALGQPRAERADAGDRRPRPGRARRDRSPAATR